MATKLYRLIELISPVERIIVSRQYLPGSILMVCEAYSEPEVISLDSYLEVTNHPASMFTPTSCDLKYAAARRLVILKSICETPVSVLTQAAGLVEVDSCENVKVLCVHDV